MHASGHAFAAACIQLYSRVWAELESLATTELQVSSVPLEILRLDLIILVHMVDSTRWHLQLTASQRGSLRAILVDVLDALDAPIENVWGFSIPDIQDRLFNAVLKHIRELNEEDDKSAPQDGLRLLSRCRSWEAVCTSDSAGKAAGI